MAKRVTKTKELDHLGFWEYLEQVAAEVETWPSWMVGSPTNTRQPAPISERSE